MNFVVGVMILGRVPTNLTGGVHLPSATYTQRGRDAEDARAAAVSSDDCAESESSAESTTMLEQAVTTSMSTSMSTGDDRTSNDRDSVGTNGESNDICAGTGAGSSDDAKVLDNGAWSDSMDCKQAEYDIFLFLQKLLDREGKLGMAGLWQSKAPSMKLVIRRVMAKEFPRGRKTNGPD